MTLDDVALLGMAVRYHEQRRHLKELEAEADALKDEILAGLEAREGRLALDGWKVASVVNERISYDFTLASERWRPAVLRRVTVRSVDKVKVAEEIDAGRLSVPDANSARLVSSSAPYVRVTPPKAPASKLSKLKAA